LWCSSGSRRKSAPSSFEQAEAEELDLIVVPARVQAVELSHTILAPDHAFAVEHEGRGTLPTRSIDDERKAVGAVVVAPHLNAHAFAAL
jgi:hemin uptake protein HemP